jgi:hypothetical protein
MDGFWKDVCQHFCQAVKMQEGLEARVHLQREGPGASGFLPKQAFKGHCIRFDNGH